MWNPAKDGPPDMNRRRSQRVILSLPVTIRADAGSQGPPFQEATQTLVLNAHGALIGLAGKVEKGQKLWLTNSRTHEELLCHVMYVGPVSGDKAQVGVEFNKPAPDFWRIAFPPENWTAPEPEPVVRKTKQS
jgi:hypothetical protein